MKAALLVVLALGGCSISTMRHVNRMGIGLSTALTACDWGQTYHAASDNWRQYRESNPVMGEAPSTNMVNTYMAAAVVSSVALWYVLPEQLKPLVWAPLTVVEVKAVGGNVVQGTGLCGVSGGAVR